MAARISGNFVIMFDKLLSFAAMYDYDRYEHDDDGRDGILEMVPGRQWKAGHVLFGDNPDRFLRYILS